MKQLRDEWGVPHIAADDETEAFRAVGYAQAEDHLPRILRHYTMARAQAAAAYGPAWIPSDRSQLRWGHFSAACRQLERLPEVDRALYDAFIGGIRAYMDAHPNELPSPVPTLHPALPIAVYRMFLWHFMVVDALEAATKGGVLDPEITDDLATIINLNGSASNEWVVLPGHTQEGAMVVVSDPHGPIGEFPTFEYRLRAGRFDFIGVACAGAMLPILGHTSGVAWGSTTGAPRVSDCYILQVRADCTEYRDGTDWHPIHRRSISLEVAGAEPVGIGLDSVRLNEIDCPVIGRASDWIAVACTPYMADDMPSMDETLIGWASARNLEEWTRATASMSMFSSNYMAGDRHGDALYARVGLVPRRGEGIDPTLPIDGFDERTRWHGFHSFDELVQTRNPACGYMHNNNEAPDTMFPGADQSDLAAEKYAPYVFNDTPGRTHDRGLHVEQALGAGPVSVEDVVQLALSDRWPTAALWRDALAAAVASMDPKAETEHVHSVVESLLGFDGDCSPMSVGALVYYYWRTSIPLVADPPGDEMRDETGRTVFQVPTGVAGESCPHSHSIWEAVESGETLDAQKQHMLLAAVRMATRRLLQDVGRVDAAFGDVFRIGVGDRDWPARSIAFASFAPEGEPTTEFVMPLRAMAALPSDEQGHRRIVSGGRSCRVVAFTDPLRSYSVVLYGQSSRPDSPHSADQCALYSEGRMRETGFATLLDATELLK